MVQLPGCYCLSCGGQTDAVQMTCAVLQQMEVTNWEGWLKLSHRLSMNYTRPLGREPASLRTEASPGQRTSGQQGPDCSWGEVTPNQSDHACL